ncbi:excinuclease ABC subunit UvrC [Halomonas sp. NyZ770]|uniref:excinuclease ABC subunit UvrC n=1 Tax=Halomonas sp. NyZ770 TaxID=2883106 RepID=UPI00054A9CAF|nr:excinuclease ABC subunit UvrC [Halomonas sp. NyZ770]KHJ49998.1 excinuclease ABC subunit C [Halomonas hydrothermalis]UDM06005.1 excinuclease ABC subunit UvrC [Halomonas sp. NyZ770]
MSFDAKQFLSSVSASPGVYKMLDEQQNALYVGKAKRLKSRLASYFRGQLNAKTQAMVSRIADIQITVTRSETEALLLEQTLIKELRPPYNILLRDDKSYPFVFVTDRHPYPALEYKRARQRRGDGKYLGPYPSSGAVRESLTLMQKIFRIRNCEDSVFAHRSRPCLQYQIERCSAPCVDYISQPEYQRDVDHAVMCLEGKSEHVTQLLTEEMEAASRTLNFEEAARLRDQIQQLRQMQQRQFVDNESGDADIFALAQRPGALGISILSVRDGRLLGARHHMPKNDLDLSPEALLTEVVSQYYFGQPHSVPSEVITNLPLEDGTLIADALAQQAGKKVRVTHQVRGHRAQWQHLAMTNAEQQLASQLANTTQLTERFTSLQQALGLPSLPERLECFDISHSQGEATVASCVVFDHQGPRKSDYRHFRIEGVAAGDDYAAMQQALTRRLKRVKSGEAIAPDVLIVDGGKGQLNMARQVLTDLQVPGIVLLGVAKGTTRKAGLETLFLESSDNPLVLAPASPALHLVQHIRDESHRFAIAGHRAARDKARRTSTLQDIPGIGPKRRRELLKFFGGLQGVQKASRDELTRVPGISAALAETIYVTLNG